MDLITSLQSLNYVAVVVATVAGFMTGGIWYAPPIFGKMWMKESGIKESDAKKSAGPAMTKSFVLTFVMATTLAMFTPETTNDGLMTGLVLGLGIGVANVLNHMVYEIKSCKLMMINAGYSLVMFAVMGAILGSWQ